MSHRVLALTWLVVVSVASTLALASSSAEGHGFAAPTPGLLQSLRERHHPSDWLRISAGAQRFEARVRVVDERGLSGLRLRDGTPPSDPLAWEQVSRIEVRHSNRRTGQVLGALLGAAVTAGLAAQTVTPHDRENRLLFTWGAIGAIGGSWAGGRVGERSALYEPIYSVGEGAVPPTPSTPLPASVVASGATGDPAGEHARDARRFNSRVGRTALLRIDSSYGTFVGRAAFVDAAGIHGLLAPAGLAGPAASPVDPLPWDAIRGVEQRTNSSGPYALLGAATFGGLGGLLGGAVATGLSGTPSDAAGGIALGALGGGLVGAGLGALLGSPIPRWSRVRYERR